MKYNNSNITENTKLKNVIKYLRKHTIVILNKVVQIIMIKITNLPSHSIKSLSFSVVTSTLGFDGNLIVIGGLDVVEAADSIFGGFVVEVSIDEDDNVGDVVVDGIGGIDCTDVECLGDNEGLFKFEDKVVEVEHSGFL